MASKIVDQRDREHRVKLADVILDKTNSIKALTTTSTTNEDLNLMYCNAISQIENKNLKLQNDSKGIMLESYKKNEVNNESSSQLMKLMEVYTEVQCFLK